MGKKRKYGTEDNRVVLTAKNSMRLHAKRCLKLNPAGPKSTPLEAIDFYKIPSKQKSYSEDEHTFIFNLITNPKLSPLAIKVGIWLFMHIRPLDDSALLDLTGKRVRNRESIGEFGEIYLSGFSNTVMDSIGTEQAIPILHELAKDQISLSKDELLHALFDLHHFQYVTVTEVSYRTSQQGRKEWKEQSQKLSKKEQDNINDELRILDSKAEYVLVELTTKLTTDDYSGKWFPLSEPEKDLAKPILTLKVSK